MPLATGSPAFAKTIGIVSVSRWRAMNVGLQADQLLRERSHPTGVNAAPTKVHPHVAAIGPTQDRKRLRERRNGGLRLGVVFVARQEQADAPHAVALLRTRRERPCRRAAEERDEVAPSNHSITSVRWHEYPAEW